MKKQLLSLLIMASALSACPAQDNTWPDPVPEPLTEVDYACCETRLRELPLNLCGRCCPGLPGRCQSPASVADGF